MKRISRTRLAAATALSAILAFNAAPSLASSHREAPAVTKTPKVDGTDFYMFRSYEPGRDGFVTMIANYHRSSLRPTAPTISRWIRTRSMKSTSTATATPPRT